jgi:hypothetical protein
MRRLLFASGVAAVCAAVPFTSARSAHGGPGSLAGLTLHRAPNPTASAAYNWVDIILQAAGREVEQVVLLLPTFSKTAEMAGLSRVLGGYHIQSDNSGGLTLGRSLAVYAWPKYQSYFDGTMHATQ